MGYTVSKSFLHQLLFALCVSVLYLDNFELTFAIWSISAAITFSKSYSVALLRYILCFAAIFMIAFIGTFFHDNYKTYFIVRDMTYLIKPIIGLLLGYQFCKNAYGKVFQTIVYTAVFIALYHVTTVFFAVTIGHAWNLNDIRMYSGFFSDFEVYAVIILLFHEKFELGFSKKRTWQYIILIGFSAFTYFARTNFIQFVILFVAMKGYFKINRTSIMVISSLLAFTIVGYSAILYVNPKRNGPGIEALLYKIKIAPIEPFKTKIDVDDWKDFNDNYRSYENIHTVKQVTSRGPASIAFGQGMGSRIDLKREVWLREMLRYISILHNGFMTVFLKSGLLGIAIYLYSIFLLFRQKKSNIAIVKNINLLLVGTGIFLIFSNWVFSGLYNLLDNKSMLIGLLFCYKEMTIKRQNSLIDDEV